MITDEHYELCLPILLDKKLADDEKSDKLEELLRSQFQISGKALEDAVLDALWRFTSASNGASSPPPSRHTVIRRPSPAPWQAARAPTPLSSSPRLIGPPPGFARAKSSTASPFTSPRPSPRMGLATPHIPHSPSLNAYEFSDSSPAPDIYGDYGSDTVDWLVNEDGTSPPSSYAGEAGGSPFVSDWMGGQMMEMSPYDMIRSILRDERTDEDIERALEGNNYDLSATIMALMGPQVFEQPAILADDKTFLVGKSMSPSVRPSTPAGQQKSSIICKYWLQTGHCARADCRFSHDPSKTVCKYWMSGNCLAADSCLFSHDPSTLVARMTLEGIDGTPPTHVIPPNFHVQDYETFPTLQTGTPEAFPIFQPSMQTFEHIYQSAHSSSSPIPTFNPFANFVPSSSRPQSRPGSRHASRVPTPSIPAVDDNEAFPTLGSIGAKAGKKHHGKRGHGHHGHKENGGPSSLADLVKMSPSPGPAQLRKGARNLSARNLSGMSNAGKESSAAAMAIPPPEHIPWLETGDAVNKAYMKARTEAFKHGGLRNKFLQSASQAWARSDSRAAKALSLRGQNENNLMREAHKHAARILYEERNKNSRSSTREIYVDLHGLHPDEAISYLSRCLRDHDNPLANSGTPRPLYAITGTGHHSKGGKDKVGKAVRAFLTEWRFAWRDFDVPGDHRGMGGVLGVDPTSWDRGLGEWDGGVLKRKDGGGEGRRPESSGGKVRILKAEDAEKR
ncbi:hypothetical protein P152DRAFT_177593 [Eremomyces bilateralis CBS 781.70]|uniref:CCCH zinc finger and SMR domain-containing protein n=1 Tax=Eremomyces bilateralis CBS 781.70 TaxID=1392243 RepID=A0A6G1FT72_9PEZI|nr:uncharacterized protein P152DRAFT_177593 [Eremomyces bilateralis CBS 781.70]KAF1808963.1 hypothetical protein P152DRAFT_177593 [Eremomyces bilateralis CBS 781.70]